MEKSEKEKNKEMLTKISDLAEEMFVYDDCLTDVAKYRQITFVFTTIKRMHIRDLLNFLLEAEKEAQKHGYTLLVGIDSELTLELE